MRTCSNSRNMISKTLKHRVSAELKRLAVLLRRLIFLMALQVELAPLVPRPASNYFEKTEGEPEARKAFFSVLPVPAGEAPDFLHGPITVPTRGPVPAAPLIARWEAMLDTLKFCRRRAKCLARTIQRWKADGEARPYIAPIPRTHAMPAAPRPRLGRAHRTADRSPARLAARRHELNLRAQSGLLPERHGRVRAEVLATASSCSIPRS
jgi:hypothetical protein